MPSVLRTDAPDDDQRIADALAGLAVPPNTLLPPPKNRVASDPADTGLGIAQAMFPYIMGGAVQPQPPVSMTPSAAPPIEPPTPAGVIEPNRMWGVPPAETLPPEGATGGKLVPPGQNPGALGLAGDLANIAAMGVGGPEAAAAKAVPLGKSILATIMARTADPRALARAMEMAAEGQTPQKIWNAARQRGEQRWWQGPDDQWVHEIPGVGSRMRKGGPTDFEQHPLSEHLDYPALYDAFPQMAKLATQRLSPQYIEFLGGSTAGGYMPWRPGKPPFILYAPEQTAVKSLAYPGQFAGPREILLHEGGHAVAQITGLPSGGTSSALKGESPGAARNRYLWNAGENAARNDQRRMNMSLNELAANPPWKTQDYPFEKQLLTYNPQIPIRRK